MEKNKIDTSDIVIDKKSSESLEINSSNLKKVKRKGDEILYAGEENVTVIKQETDDNKLSAGSTQEQVDPVSSGESLYKSLSFDNVISKEETEKCISFWRSVVEKNLEPLKCIIIENLNDKKPIANGSSGITGINANKEKNKRLNKSLKKGSKEENKSDLQRNVWFDTLQELQKKRLNEIKLMAKSRCTFCDTLTASYESGVKDEYKQQLQEHFKELDSWEPKSTKPKRFSGVRLSKERQNNDNYKLPKSKLNKSNEKAGVSKLETISIKLESQGFEQQSEPKPTDLKLERIKEASNKIEYVDAIEKKKQDGCYSSWRENKLAKTCKCLSPDCNCNTNPAVIKIKNMAQDGPNVNPALVEESMEINKAIESKSKDSTTNLDDIKVATQCKDKKNSITQGTLYTNESLDEHSITTDSDIEPAAVSADPVEKKRSNGSIQRLLPPANASNIENVSENITLLEYDETQTIISPKPKIRLRKALSIMLNCVCSNDDCDCGNFIEFRKKQMLSAKDKYISPPPKLNPKPQKVSSLELIHKRFSRASIGAKKSFSE